MSQYEAKKLLVSQLRELKKLSFSEFRSWIVSRNTESLTVKGASGAEYEIEIEIDWYGKPGANILVSVSIVDGPFPAAFCPLCAGFVISPDGSFVAE